MNSEGLVNGQPVNDQNWFKIFLPILIWLIFWFVELFSYTMYAGGYFGYKSILFIVGMGFLLFGIFSKNGFFYRIGFYIYSGFAAISIIMDIILIIIIWFFFEIINKIISVTLDVGGEGSKEAEQAKNIVNWVLIGYKCFFTFFLALDILCELCFLCVLKRKIPYFDAYEIYKNQQLQTASPV